jgi:aspartate racemase
VRTIGLIGGMSWESTAVYYRLLNEGARERLGGLHSARLLLYSFDFQEIESYQAQDNWVAAAGRLASAAQALERAGADCLLLCTNTMHKVADQLARATAVPLIHITDSVAAAMATRSLTHPLLLGTRFTMEEDFYLGRLRDQFGVTVVLPEEADRLCVHNMIYDELCIGSVLPDSRVRLLEIVEQAARAGADSVILGCTELGLLLSDGEASLPVLDSCALHVVQALDFALEDDRS